MVIRQGDLIWVLLPRPRGSEPAGRRPAVVIQSDNFNRSRINTIVIAVITSNMKYASMPGNVRLSKGEGGIPKGSVINLSQIFSVDRSYIDSRIGSLSSRRISEVRFGLKTVFDLE